MYKNVQGPHSPLTPIPPMDFLANIKSTWNNGKYLTPVNSQRNINLRRSFTPQQLNNITPPSASPIKPVNNTSDVLGDNESQTKLEECASLIAYGNEETKLMDISERITFAFNKYITPKAKANKMASGKTFTVANKKNLVTSFFHSTARSISKLNLDGTQNDSVKHSRSRNKLCAGTPMCEHTNTITTTTTSTAGKNSTRTLPQPRCLCYSPLSIDTPQITVSKLSPMNFNNSLLNESLKIETVFKEIHMEKYIEQFTKEEIDLYVFSLLDESDLDELNIDEMDRPIMLEAINTFSSTFNDSFRFA